MSDMKLPIETVERAVEHLCDFRAEMSWLKTDSNDRNGNRTMYNELCDFIDLLNKEIGANAAKNQWKDQL